MERSHFNFTEGEAVNIQRSDGRVHEAVIISLNRKTRLVIVEWNEKGEFKRKELDFLVIADLNKGVQNSNIVSTNKEKNISKRRDTIHSFETSLAATAIPLESVSKFCTDMAQDVPGVSVRRKTRATAKYIETIREKETDRRLTCTIQEGRRRKVPPAAQQTIHEDENWSAVSIGKIDNGNPNWEFQKMINEYLKNMPYKPISLDDTPILRRICVAIRKRPLNRKEIQQKELDVVSILTKDHVLVHEAKFKVDLKKYLENHQFKFDYTFDETADNEIVYYFTARPLLGSVFRGGTASVFAYGQTGSGKTHTMGADSRDKKNLCNSGIFTLTARDLFEILESRKNESENLMATVSFFEIYSGRVIDLMNAKAHLRVLEDGNNKVQIVGLKEINVANVEDVLKVIQTGSTNRSSGKTSANQNSSRSHAILQINLKKRISGALHGKFSIIDLAGNERGADTMSACRKTRMEGAEINKSLLALKECIRALSFKSGHLPFRASILTQVLRDSFIGENSKVTMIATLSPGMASCEHTLNTLRYANRVKELELEPIKMEAAAEILLRSVPKSYEESPVEKMKVSNLYDSLHEVLDQINDQEDEVISFHKRFIDLQSNWSKVLGDLLKETNVQEYDIDGYVQNLEILLYENMDTAKEFLEKVSSLKERLNAEEDLSQKLKKGC